MSFDFKTILLYIICLAVLVFVLKLFKKPLKWVIRLLFSCVLGGLALFVLNLLIIKTGFHFPINPLNALTVGVLGIPGIVLLGFINIVL